MLPSARAEAASHEAQQVAVLGTAENDWANLCGMQAFARVRKQIAVLMRLAAPARHPCGDRSLQARRAIDDEKGRPPQAALDQIR